ncbi:P-loop containing nucleoside triphosphate hydrolase protein [Aspergillus sergii]|uniref:P-loop containing nucleoside triphosphate hydrolase protein n=1 Tax=Aspergillus sergii TaxID=1034303 RepID=A0A5N6WRS7_9EURO|nr:P-loop containing nucleoside triphosphate hydrolase protein [Aspergillus sergii]
MSFQAIPGSLPAGAPTGLEKLWDLIGMDITKLINFAFVFGAALTFLNYVSRSMLSYLSCFTTKVRLDDDDPLYQRVLQWITDHHPPSPRLCSMRAISSDQSSVEEEALLGSMKGREVKNQGKFISYRELVEQPLIKLRPHAGKHLFRYNGKWIFFSHTVASENQYTQLMKERCYIQLQCFGSSVDTLQDLLQEAQSYNLDKTMTMTTVYRPTCSSESAGRWSKYNTRPSRNISTVIFDRKKKEELLNDINEYLHPRTRRWYSDHGIPYRRGYLFSGAPGMGKTSLASALAGLFGLNIYVLSLLDPNLNESKLMKLMSDIPSRCIVLLEDVDAAGLGRRNLRGEQIKTAADSVKLGAADFSANQLYTPPPSGAQTPVTTISLSGLLNAIDGVSAQEGRILVMTTNSPESLDAALIRPGRVDMHVDFQLPSLDQMRELFVNMYSDLSIDVSEDTKDPARSLDAMADTFASSIPERSVSLARLQGYLLQYKQCPREASRGAAEWAKENRTV